ncbi:BrnA antitoxin family protein [Rhodospirillum centenum]|uniref:BrnA antitoxin of type II toxin-antitoxin system n=1 Tax=Rhodospirillum centenum (strain ATCC 51521 / SW) TaxID=414684 RepID=B6IVZ4_RHOCS|nr:BrnA antitoxin family protein [Rhodospirillum centenum]ACJ00468.1 conserved hypothetical protein [Rhodospirillum centenum SW]
MQNKFDPDDAPDLSAPEWQRKFAQARRGRPPAQARPKVATSLRLDADVVERLRQDGPGWQTRANALLRNALGL